MLGQVFLLAYRLVVWRARWMGREAGDGSAGASAARLAAAQLQARWALRFSSMTDGGLDDDFAEELFQLFRCEPQLLDRLQSEASGTGWSMRRRQMLLVTIRSALASGRQTLF